MNILTVLIVIILFGVLLWLANTYLPLDPKIKKILNVVAVVALIIWLLKVFNVFHFLSNANI